MSLTHPVHLLHRLVVPQEKPIITQIAKRYPKNIIIWDHGGIAPEVTPLLTAAEHIAA
jgi:hypothetical protein